MYFAWDRSAEAGAPLGVLENRFPALFEVRRLFWPLFERLADAGRFDQGIDGFIEHIFFENFALFSQTVQTLTGNPLRTAQRRTPTGSVRLDRSFLSGADTVIIIGFDSMRTGQQATANEIGALREFLADPDHMLFVCPHHDIGVGDGVPQEKLLAQQTAEFHHHGDVAIPGQQRFGAFAVSVMRGLGLPIQNRFGLRPARNPDGSPAPFALVAADRSGLLDGVPTLNLHPHLPHFERHDASLSRLEVLVRQPIDAGAPEHPSFGPGRRDFDAILQAAPGEFAGHLLVTDSTLWTSVFGGIDSLTRLWRNVALRPSRLSTGHSL